MNFFISLFLTMGIGFQLFGECTADLYRDYDKMDRNGDGIVSPGEFQIQAGEIFHYIEKHNGAKRSFRTIHLDMDNDGSISHNDYKISAELKGLIFLKLSQNYQGCSVAKLGTFAKMDVNKDGTLTRSELRAMQDAVNSSTWLTSGYYRIDLYYRYSHADLDGDQRFGLSDLQILKSVVNDLGRFDSVTE